MKKMECGLSVGELKLAKLLWGLRGKYHDPVKPKMSMSVTTQILFSVLTSDADVQLETCTGTSTAALFLSQR